MHRVILAIALACMAAVARAATITTRSTCGYEAMPVTDTDGPTDSGAILSETIVPTDAFNTMEARAALDVDGNSAIALDGMFFYTDKPHLAGIDFPQITAGETAWTTSVTNTGQVPRSYVYRFLLHPFQLLLGLYNTRHPSDPEASEVSFAVEVHANDVLIFEARAALRGGWQGHSLTTSGTDLGGVFGMDEGALWYDFAQYQGAVSAGTANPGETITVEAKLIARTESHLTNGGGSVTMGDPLDLKGDPGVSSVIFDDGTVGVEPATWSAAKRLYR
jgi:hypothetical protein